MTAARTYADAIREYDEAFEHELVEVVMEAIARASMVTDANAIVMRTGETASALLTVLAATVAMSPAAVRSPTAMCKTLDELGKRLRRRVAAAQADANAFRERVFTSGDVGGNA
jgi:transposase